jgi:hypothetical protein
MKTIIPVIRLIMMSLVLSISLLSCTNEIESPIYSGKGSVILNFTFNNSQSRVDAIDEENHVKQIGLVFYSSDVAGAYVANTVINLPATDTPTTSVSFDLPEELGATGKYRVLAFASGNSKFYEGDDMTQFLAASSAKSYAEMKNDVYLSNTNAMSFLLPFSGNTTLDNKGDGASTINVILSRTVAKMTLNNGAGNFYLAGVKMGNYRSAGHMFHQEIYRGNIVRRDDTSPYLVPTAQHVAKGLYAFPNMVGVTAQDDKVTTCLVIKGYYSENAWVGDIPADAKLTYYRINISRGNGKSQILKLNNLYNVTINSVNGHGSDSEDDAMKDKTNKINISINDWEEDNDDGFITDPHGNYIRYSPKSIDFQPIQDMVKYVNIEVKAGTYWKYSVKRGDASFGVEQDPGNPNRLMVKTLLDGDEILSRLGEIELTVFKDGETTELPALTSTVNLIQFSKNMEKNILSVDGKVSDFLVTATPRGSVFEYEVMTGSQYNGWVAEPVVSSLSWIKATKFGGDGSTLRIVADPNSSANRTGTVTVHFDGDGTSGPDDPNGSNPDVPRSVVITINQSVADDDITITPAYSQTDPLIVHGIDAALDLYPNGCSGIYDINISTIDNTKHQYVTIETTFDPTKVSVEVPNSLKYNENSSITVTTGSNFRIFVKETVPGSLPFEGNVSIRITDKNGNPTDGLDPIFFDMKVETDCVSPTTIYDPNKLDDYIWIDVPEEVSADKRMYIYDRDAGIKWTEDTKTALPYSSNYPESNTSWKGAMVKAADIKANLIAPGGQETKLCMDGWAAPNAVQVALMADRVRVARGRAYILSDEVLSGDAHRRKASFISVYWLYDTPGSEHNRIGFMSSDQSLPWVIAQIIHPNAMESIPAPLTWNWSHSAQAANGAILRCVRVVPPTPPAPDPAKQ